MKADHIEFKEFQLQKLKEEYIHQQQQYLLCLRLIMLIFISAKAVLTLAVIPTLSLPTIVKTTRISASSFKIN